LVDFREYRTGTPVASTQLDKHAVFTSDVIRVAGASRGNSSQFADWLLRSSPLCTQRSNR